MNISRENTITIWASPVHNPTENQGSFDCYIKEDNPKLAKRIENCPDNIEDIDKLFDDLIVYLESKRNIEILIIELYALGGSPAFQARCFQRGLADSFHCYFSHTERISEENKQPDGSVTKINVFKHKNWIGL